MEVDAECMEAARALVWELAGGKPGVAYEIKRLWEEETKAEQQSKNEAKRED